ncbi:hypothetical protein MRX96_020391 [Rhipicephalus microplus]
MKECGKTTKGITEFFWGKVRPKLPTRNKKRLTQGEVRLLGDCSIPEYVNKVLKLEPKFTFEPNVPPTEKVAFSRKISWYAPEGEQIRGSRGPPAPGIPRNILEVRACTSVLNQRQRLLPRRAVSSAPPPAADARRADVVAHSHATQHRRELKHKRRGGVTLLASSSTCMRTPRTNPVTILYKDYFKEDTKCNVTFG